jgi:hypothetical protein
MRSFLNMVLPHSLLGLCSLGIVLDAEILCRTSRRKRRMLKTGTVGDYANTADGEKMIF